MSKANYILLDRAHNVHMLITTGNRIGTNVSSVRYVLGGSLSKLETR